MAVFSFEIVLKVRLAVTHEAMSGMTQQVDSEDAMSDDSSTNRLAMSPTVKGNVGCNMYFLASCLGFFNDC